MNNTTDNEEIWKAVREIGELYRGTDSHHMETLAHDEQRDQNHAIHIRKVLNYYETMAVCINHGIYDDTILRELMYTTVVEFWKQAKPYVEKKRNLKNKKTFYQEAELLVCRWQKIGLAEKVKP